MAKEKFPRSNTRQLIDFSNLESVGSEEIIVCINRAVLEVASYFLHTRAMWPTTYYTQLYEDGYEKPTKEQMEWLENLILEFGGNMALCEQLTDGVERIALALESGNQISGNCCGATSATYILVEGNVYYGTQQPLTPPTTFGGVGEFSDEAEYQAHKCSAANSIVDGLIITLNGMSVYSLASILAGGIVIAFFVATPPVAILIGLATLGFLFGSFFTMANYLDTHRQEWVCALYTSDTYGDWLTSLVELVNELEIELSLGFADIPLQELFKSMVDTDTFNKMFTPLGLPVVSNPVDCSLCPSQGDLWEFAEFCNEGYVAGTLVSGEYFGAYGAQSVPVNWSCDPGTQLSGIVMATVAGAQIHINGTSSGPVLRWWSSDGVQVPYAKTGTVINEIIVNTSLIIIRDDAQLSQFTISGTVIEA